MNKLYDTNKKTNKIADIFDVTSSIVLDKKVSSTVIVIPHVCNNVSVFNGGFAKDVAEHYPIVKENFMALGKKYSQLGKVQYIEVYSNTHSKNKIIIANMIAQNGIISSSNTRPLNYCALVYCMNDINRYIDSLYKNNSDVVDIHCPKFGSGLAGGNWVFIQDLIKDIWKNHQVYVYSKSR